MNVPVPIAAAPELLLTAALPVHYGGARHNQRTGATAQAQKEEPHMTTSSRVVLTLSSFLCCVLSSLIFWGDVTWAAEQLVPTRTLVVRNPPSGALRRKIVWRVRDV